MAAAKHCARQNPPYLSKFGEAFRRPLPGERSAAQSRGRSLAPLSFDSALRAYAPDERKIETGAQSSTVRGLQCLRVCNTVVHRRRHARTWRL
jgi:hypothetical protein